MPQARVDIARGLALFAILFAAYAATLGTRAFGHSDYGGDEPHYLLTAESIVSDGDFDLTDEYLDHSYRSWYPYELDRHGVFTAGRLNEPHGIGLPLLIAPAYALAGPKGAELFLAALAALAFVLAAALARRLVPEPWATLGPLVGGLSAPALAYGAAIYPEGAAGAALCGAALLALRVRERPRVREAAACGALIALLPWLEPKLLMPGAVIGLLLARWCLRRQRGMAALVAGEVVLTSLVVFVSVNDGLFGGATPYAAVGTGEGATGADGAGGYASRAYRLVALPLDRDYGLLRWAPIFCLSLFAVWLLWRSRRERLTRALPERIDAEAAAGLLVLVCAAQVLVAAFLSPTMFGFWFPGRHLVVILPVASALAAWGLRHAPRAGAVLAAITLAGSGWLYAELRLDDGAGWVASGSSAPWGPLERLFPAFGTGSAWPAVVVAAVLAAGAALLLHELAATARRASDR